MIKRKTIFSLVLYLLFFTVIVTSYAGDNPESVPQLFVFYSPSCHKCIEVKQNVLPEIEKKFKDKIKLEYYDISEIENYKLLLGLKQKYDPGLKIVVPLFFLEGRFLSGEKADRESVEKLIQDAPGARSADKSLSRPAPAVNLVEYFKTFKAFTIASVGLVDGINPCAFTVIVFFISFLALQGYVRRELIAIGLCFIFAVFITYLLIGLGAFTFLYRISHFRLIIKAANLLIGIFSVVLGYFALYDFFKFKKTGKTEGLTLQLPQSIKNQIHKVIGMHYRADKKLEGAFSKRSIFKLMISALITGFLVSILEAVCTGQTYLPTITFILKTTNLKLQALGLLLLYNFMFIVPLLLIFIFALFGVSSAQFSNILKKHLLVIKILMATLFFGLGIFLIWRA